MRPGRARKALGWRARHEAWACTVQCSETAFFSSAVRTFFLSPACASPATSPTFGHWPCRRRPSWPVVTAIAAPSDTGCGAVAFVATPGTTAVLPGQHVDRSGAVKASRSRSFAFVGPR
jgi:hypothetical protein